MSNNDFSFNFDNTNSSGSKDTSTNNILDSLSKVTQNAEGNLNKKAELADKFDEALAEARQEVNDFNTLSKDQFTYKYGDKGEQLYNSMLNEEYKANQLKESRDYLNSRDYSVGQFLGDKVIDFTTAVGDMARGSNPLSGITHMIDTGWNGVANMANAIKPNSMNYINTTQYVEAPVQAFNEILNNLKSDYSKQEDLQIARDEEANTAEFNQRIDNRVANGELTENEGKLVKNLGSFVEGAKSMFATPNKAASTLTKAGAYAIGYGGTARLSKNIVKNVLQNLGKNDKVAKNLTNKIVNNKTMMANYAVSNVNDYVNETVDNFTDKELYENYEEFRDYYKEGIDKGLTPEEAVEQARENYKDELFGQSLPLAVPAGYFLGKFENLVNFKEQGGFKAIRANLAKQGTPNGKDPSIFKEMAKETAVESVEEGLETLEPIVAAAKLNSDVYDAYSDLSKQAGAGMASAFGTTPIIATPGAIREKAHRVFREDFEEKQDNLINESFEKSQQKDIVEPTVSEQILKDNPYTEETKQDENISYQDYLKTDLGKNLDITNLNSKNISQESLQKFAKGLSGLASLSDANKDQLVQNQIDKFNEKTGLNLSGSDIINYANNSDKFNERFSTKKTEQTTKTDTPKPEEPVKQEEKKTLRKSFEESLNTKKDLSDEAKSVITNVLDEIDNNSANSRMSPEINKMFNLKEDTTLWDGVTELFNRAKKSNNIEDSRKFVQYVEAIQEQESKNGIVNSYFEALDYALSNGSVNEDDKDIQTATIKYLQDKTRPYINYNSNLRNTVELVKNKILQDTQKNKDIIKKSFSDDMGEDDDWTRDYKKQLRSQAVDSITSRSNEIDQDIIDMAYDYINSNKDASKEFTPKQIKTVKEIYNTNHNKELNDALNKNSSDNSFKKAPKMSKFLSKFRKGNKQAVRDDITL